MKKIIKGIKVGLVCVMILSIMLLVAYSETHYTRTGFVKKKGMITDEYSFYDSTGNVWIFETEEKLDSDMVVEVQMFNNNTMDNIKDDIIIDYKVTGRND